MGIKDFLWCIVITGIITFGVISYFSIPDVYWSTSKNECIKVIHDGVQTGCKDLPDKYNRIWVE